MLKHFLAITALMTVGFAAEPAEPARVQSLKITILSTMLADGRELGEWGFAALVEVDGRRILFDTGTHPDLVLKNARSLGIDLTSISDVVLSHHHPDHVGGLLTLREAVRSQTPAALARVHVAEGIFYPRVTLTPAVDSNPMVMIKPSYEAIGGAFHQHSQPVQLQPGVWLTGPIPRRYPERNWSGQDRMKSPAGIEEDTLPEDQALVINTEQGLVVLVGCSHAGVINTLEYARSIVRAAPIHALIGGIHVFSASDETLRWTASKFVEFGLQNFMGAHCTGIEPVYRFRESVGLDRAHAVVGAVGAGFRLGQGIEPRMIAR